jgi:hypothetical protein
MPTIGYRNTYIPNPRVPQAKTPAKSYAGDAAVGDALMQIGQVMAKVEANRQDSALEYYKVQAGRDLGVLYTELEQIQDPGEQEEVYRRRSMELLESYKEPVSKMGVDFDTRFLPQYEMVRAKYDVHVAALRANTAHKQSVNMAQSVIEQRRNIAAEIDDDEIRMNQIRGIEIDYRNGVRNGLWTEAEANAMFNRDKNHILRGMAATLIDRDPVRAIIDLKDPEKFQGLDRVMRQDLVKAAEATKEHREAKSLQEQRIIKEETRQARIDQYWRDVQAGKLSMAKVIADPMIQAADKEWIRDRVKERALELKKSDGANDIFNQENEATQAALTTLVWTRPEEVAQKGGSAYIFGFVGNKDPEKRIKIATAEHLSNTLKQRLSELAPKEPTAKEPLKRKEADAVFQALSDAYNKGLFGDKSDQEALPKAAMTWGKHVRTMTAVIEKYPQNPEVWSDELQKILQPAKGDAAKKLLLERFGYWAQEAARGVPDAAAYLQRLRDELGEGPVVVKRPIVRPEDEELMREAEAALKAQKRARTPQNIKEAMRRIRDARNTQK